MGLFRQVRFSLDLFLTGVSNGFTDLQAGDHKVVVATGLFQRMELELHLKLGVLVVTDTENVTVIDAETGLVLVEVSTIQKLLVQLVDVNTLYVLVVHIVVVLENVQDVMVVHPM